MRRETSHRSRTAVEKRTGSRTHPNRPRPVSPAIRSPGGHSPGPTLQFSGRVPVNPHDNSREGTPLPAGPRVRSARVGRPDILERSVIKCQEISDYSSPAARVIAAAVAFYQQDGRRRRNCSNWHLFFRSAAGGRAGLLLSDVPGTHGAVPRPRASRRRPGRPRTRYEDAPGGRGRPGHHGQADQEPAARRTPTRASTSPSSSARSAGSGSGNRKIRPSSASQAPAARRAASWHSCGWCSNIRTS